MSTPRISIILPDLRAGGAEILHFDLALEFSRRGFDVEFALMSNSGELFEQVSELFSVAVMSSKRYRYLIYELYNYISRRDPAIIIAPMWPISVVAPLSARFARRGRVLISEHNTLSNQYRNNGIIHSILLRASMFAGYSLANFRVGVSSGVCEDMALLSGLSPNLFDVIHNPVRLGKTPSERSVKFAERQWPTGRRRVLSVGSLKAQKNHELLLRATAKTDAGLVIVGAGPELDKLTKLAHDLSVSDRVVFVGYQSEPSAFYNTADLFVLSSDYEGFGNVIVEALSHGLPVVSTDCPSGPSEILEDGKWGRLVPVGDADALANAINEVLGGSVDADALRRRAAAFSPKVAADRYLNLMGFA